MNDRKKSKNFIIFTLLVSTIIIVTLGLFVMYGNDSLDVFVNNLFIVAIVVLLVGFISVIVVNLRDESKKKSEEELNDNENKNQIPTVTNDLYYNLFNIPIVIVAIGIVLLIASFCLTLVSIFSV